MSMRDMIPARRSGLPARSQRTDAVGEFHREVDRLFERMFGDMGFGSVLPVLGPSLGAAWPRVNVAESDKEIVVTAELPGVEEKDVKVEIEEEALVLRGEMHREREEKGRRWTRVESEAGAFNRVVPLPAAVDAEKAKAVFAKGVLTITLPRKMPVESRRKTIEVKAA